MKIYSVAFVGFYPVSCGLVISANSKEEAEILAAETITHTDEFTVTEVEIKDGPQVIFYESGDY